MRIVNYRLGKNEDGICRLLRENAINYDVNLGPESISRMMREIYKLDMLAEEFVYLLAISGKRIIGVFEISHGSVDMATFSAKNIFTRLLLLNCSRFVLVHSHPSGNTSPSKEDIQLTKSVWQAGKLLNCELQDHIIIGDGYYSFYENDVMPE